MLNLVDRATMVRSDTEASASRPAEATVARPAKLRSMSDTLALGRRILASQPFSVLVGAELLSLGEGHAALRIPIRAELKRQHGFVHGGVISYAADNTLTFAGGSVLGTGVVTSEFKVNYLRPAQGDSLVARATVIHFGRTQAVCRCDVFSSEDGADRLCATAQGTIATLAANPRDAAGRAERAAGTTQ